MQLVRVAHLEDALGVLALVHLHVGILENNFIAGTNKHVFHMIPNKQSY